jgi:hypothetical protein
MKVYGFLFTALASSVVLSGPVMAEKPIEVPIRNWQAPNYYQLPAEMDVQRTQAQAEAARSGPRDGETVSSEIARPEATPQSLAARDPFVVVTPPPIQLVFVAVTPCRIVDTRAGSGFASGYGPPSLVAGAQRSFTVTGQCGIPTGAQAVSFNFAVWVPTTRGDLRAFPAGGGTPTVSTLNWEAGILALANAAVVPLGSGALTVQLDSTTPVDIFVDVNGYYTTASTPYYGGFETSGSLTSGSGYLYDAVGLNIGSSTKCLVTAWGGIPASSSITRGLVYPAWRVNGTTTDNTYNNWCFVASAPSANWQACSVSGIFTPTGSATNTYDFGCSFSQFTPSATYTGICHATVICFP